THTWVYQLRYYPDDAERFVDDDGALELIPGVPIKDKPAGSYPFARYRMDRIDAQDYTMWETQGVMANRPGERLATSDRGIIMGRELIKQSIERVMRGEDPPG